jgi:hypothetical protein
VGSEYSRVVTANDPWAVAPEATANKRTKQVFALLQIIQHTGRVYFVINALQHTSFQHHYSLINVWPMTNQQVHKLIELNQIKLMATELSLCKRRRCRSRWPGTLNRARIWVAGSYPARNIDVFKRFYFVL